MTLLSRVYLLPHFPALLLDEEQGRTERIHEALDHVRRALSAEAVEAVVVLAAHWNPAGPFQVDNGAKHKTLLDMEGIPVELKYSCDGWVDLANALHENGIANGLPVEVVHRGMDHSASVPMSFLFPAADRRIVALSASKRSRDDYVLWGAVVRETCRGAGARIAVVAGGSLSYDPEAHRRGEDRARSGELDLAILGRLEAGDWDGLEALPAELVATGRPMAGLRHLWFVEGVLGRPMPGRILAHHRHPSVGSAVVEFRLPE